uniref:Uncharacterized protein n=1 Tax=Oryza glumipatula TaxID=40148 RepID=A0A0D9YZI6_9ORYZ
MRSRLTPSAAIAAIAAFSGDMKSKPTQSVVSGHSSLNDPSSADGGSARCLRLFRLAGWLVTFSSSHALPLTPTVTARGCSVARRLRATATQLGDAALFDRPEPKG